jgi:hypothetical protein
MYSILLEYKLLQFIYLFQILLDIINFVKIKISSLNTKSQTQNQMQYIL